MKNLISADDVPMRRGMVVWEIGTKTAGRHWFVCQPRRIAHIHWGLVCFDEKITRFSLLHHGKNNAGRSDVCIYATEQAAKDEVKRRNKLARMRPA